MALRTSDFHYDLPKELIAQRPVSDRDSSRLLHLDRSTGSIVHHVFKKLPDLLNPGDRLVFNDTRVLPARLFCKKATGAAIELLFVERIDSKTWIVMARPGKHLQPGVRISLKSDPAVQIDVREVLSDGRRVIGLVDNLVAESFEEVLEKYGSIPLPPYIDRDADLSDTDRYQTVFARESGAVAAPTAGLHFTPDVFARLASRGIDCSFVTLHVGIGTFKPVSVSDPHEHPMHRERFNLPAAAVEGILKTKAAGGRVIAVGTTVVRVLESCSVQGSALKPGPGSTDIFILPGYEFKTVDGMVTNFHLPQSTLLMLVSAFAGHTPVMAAYHEAVAQKYRFFSYGDAMLVI